MGKSRVILILILLISLFNNCSFFVEKELQNYNETGKIIFVSRREGNYDIYIMDLDDNTVINLTNHSESDIQPASSPDGTKIVFTSYRDGEAELYIMDINGGNLKKLTDNQATDFSPVWSPDGEKIAFISDRDGMIANNNGKKGEIYIINQDGTNPVRITSDENYYHSLSWSSNMNQLAVCSSHNVQGAYFSNHVYILNLNTGEQASIPDFRQNDCDPQWLHDTNKILFISDRTGISNIFLADIDNNSVIQITDENFYHDSVSWAQDGEKIVYSARENGNYDLFLMDLNTKQVEQLTFESNNNFSPQWISLKNESGDY